MNFARDVVDRYDPRRTALIELARDGSRVEWSFGQVSAGSVGLAARLLAANDGRPVDAVFEMAGGAVFEQSLRALAPFGRLVAYGTASGDTPRVNAGQLMQGSTAVVGFWLVHCLGSPAMSHDVLERLFELVAQGRLAPVVGETYPLAEAARAHRDLAARTTTGKLLLDPGA